MLKGQRGHRTGSGGAATPQGGVPSTEIPIPEVYLGEFLPQILG